MDAVSSPPAAILAPLTLPACCELLPTHRLPSICTFLHQSFPLRMSGISRGPLGHKSLTLAKGHDV
jgi:hypothetical protein